MTAIAVAVVNYNTRGLLRTCLRSILQERPAELIVVDNASLDGSTAMVQAEFPEVTLCANEENVGFAGGLNQAVARCASPYVLLLNSDTVLAPGVLQGLSAYLDQNSSAGVVGPRLLNPDGSLQPSCYHVPTPLHVLLELSSLGAGVRFIPILRRYYLRSWAHDYARPVPWVLGAAMAVRRSAFEAVGGFDESFFMYCEEVDFCLRLRQAGWETHFAPVGEIVHVGGASTAQQRAAMAFRALMSTVSLYQRHFPASSAARLRVVMTLSMQAKLLRDRVRLRLAADPQLRERLLEDVHVWRQVLAEGRQQP
jgi:GT2 family glycosyltransferase